MLPEQEPSVKNVSKQLLLSRAGTLGWPREGFFPSCNAVILVWIHSLSQHAKGEHQVRPEGRNCWWCRVRWNIWARRGGWRLGVVLLKLTAGSRVPVSCFSPSFPWIFGSSQPCQSFSCYFSPPFCQKSTICPSFSRLRLCLFILVWGFAVNLVGGGKVFCFQCRTAEPFIFPARGHGHPPCSTDQALSVFLKALRVSERM